MKFVQVSSEVVINLDAYAAFAVIDDGERAQAFTPNGSTLCLSEDAGIMLKRCLTDAPNSEWIYILDDYIECIINLNLITKVRLIAGQCTVYFGSGSTFGYNGDEDDLSFDEDECSICPDIEEIKSASFRLIKAELNPVEIYCECGQGSRRDTRW